MCLDECLCREPSYVLLRDVSPAAVPLLDGSTTMNKLALFPFLKTNKHKTHDPTSSFNYHAFPSLPLPQNSPKWYLCSLFPSFLLGPPSLHESIETALVKITGDLQRAVFCHHIWHSWNSFFLASGTLTPWGHSPHTSSVYTKSLLFKQFQEELEACSVVQNPDSAWTPAPRWPHSSSSTLLSFLICKTGCTTPSLQAVTGRGVPDINKWSTSSIWYITGTRMPWRQWPGVSELAQEEWQGLVICREGQRVQALPSSPAKTRYRWKGRDVCKADIEYGVHLLYSRENCTEDQVVWKSDCRLFAL